MKFIKTALEPAHLIEMEKRGDERGFFTRAWCRKECAAAGLHADFVQVNISGTVHKGTVRGMHYQVAPWEEVKLVRCVRGRIHDVITDLRPHSPTYGQWMGVDLDASEHKWIYVPEGFAHGFQSLTDDVEVMYQVSQYYHPEAERGFRHNDAFFAIQWPEPVTVLSAKDAGWPGFVPAQEQAAR